MGSIQRFTLALVTFTSLVMSAGLVAQQNDADDQPKIGFPTATVFVEFSSVNDLLDIEEHALTQVERIENQVANLKAQLDEQKREMSRDEIEAERGELEENLSKLRNKASFARRTIALFESTLGGEQEDIDELGWALAFHENVNIETFLFKKTKPQIHIELTDLKEQRAGQLEIHGAGHPSVLNVDKGILALNRRLALADLALGEAEGATNLITETLEKLKAEQLDQIEVIKAERKKIDSLTKSLSHLDIDVDAIRSELQMRETVLQAAQERVRATPRIRPDFELQAVTSSPEFLRSFARKHQELFQADDVDALARELAQRIVVKNDEYDQRNVFTVSFRHDSTVFSKLVLKLLVFDIKNSIKLNPNLNLDQLDNTVQDLEANLEFTYEAIRNHNGEDPDKLQKLKARKVILEQRFLESIPMLEKATQATPAKQQIDFQVLVPDWNLTSEAELEEYNALRKQIPGLPKLKYVAPKKTDDSE